MSDLEACRELLNEYFQRTRMTHDEFAVAINYTRPYVSKVLNGNEKISEKFIEHAVEAFAKHEVLKCRSEARELFALRGIDIPPKFWTRSAFSKLKNDDPPASGGLKEQPQVPATGQVEDTPAAVPDKPQEQPTPVVPHAPLVAQSSGDINLQSSPQSSPALAQRPKGIVTRHKRAIAFSVILIVAALVAGSFVIDWFPLWGLFHKAPTLPAVSWGPARAITCGDLFNPVNPAEQIPTTPTNTNSNITTCATTSDGHVILSFRKIQNGSPELDVKEGRGPSSSTYRVTLRMDLSPTAGVPQIAGCILMDTRPDEDIGEVVCVHSNGRIEVLDAATMGSGSKTQHLEDDKVVPVNDPANVPVVVERVDNKIYIEVADQVIQPVNPTTDPGTIGFLAVGTQGSLQMSAIELA